jgi:2-polyprenyl-6-methoxyphenol hydroxylase-like FAD-dependent oxidoreductase
MKIAIIGGGIGGLTTAIALQKNGFTDITVYEAAPKIEPIGAGILLAANAMNIFHRLGIVEQMQAAGNALESAGLGNHHGTLLTKVDFLKIIKNYGFGTIAIHRGKLQQVLLQNIGKTVVVTGKRLKNIVYTEGVLDLGFGISDFGTVTPKPETRNPKYTEGGTQLEFQDGTTAKADIIIGADGIHSVVRKHIFGDIPLRYSGQTCWRGIAKMQLDNPKATAELWGTRAGLRASLVQVNDTEVYWYITLKHAAGLKLSKEETKPYLLDLVSEFNSPIQKAVQCTENQHILHNDLSDFKPIKSWYKDNIVLIGDAAHATTPNLGQGACQAIEDALALADSLKSTPSVYSVNKAFLNYQNARMKKVLFVVNTSLQIGQLSNIGGAIGYRFRNFLLRIAPNSVADRQFDYLFKSISNKTGQWSE